MIEEKSSSRCIVVIRTSSIGDVVLSTVCLDMARRTNAKVIWVGKSPTLELLELGYPEVEFFKMDDALYSKEFEERIGKLEGGSICLNLQGNLRSIRLERKLKRRGFKVVRTQKRRIARNLLVFKSFVLGRTRVARTYQGNESFSQWRLALDSFCESLSKIGIDSDLIEFEKKRARPNLESIRRSDLIESSSSHSWSKELAFGKWLAVAPGAAFEPKRLPVDYWHDLFECLLQNADGFTSKDLGILILGGESDRQVSLEFIDKLGWSGPVINLVGKLSLSQTALALCQVRLLLTNDSGLLHIAESVGTPVVAFFGPTSELFGFTPWMDNSKYYSSRIGCRPCSRHGDKPCRYGDYLFFRTISVSEVCTGILKRINEPKS